MLRLRNRCAGWPSRGALLLQLLRGLARDHVIPDHPHVRDELIDFLSAELEFLQTEAGRLYPSLGVHAGVDPAARDALWDLVQRRKSAICVMLHRGIQRGQIVETLDLDHGYQLLWGPVYYRFLGSLVGRSPIEDDFVTALVDNVLAGLAARETAG